MTEAAYDHPIRNCTFLGQTGPTVFFPKANAVDHYVWHRPDGEFLVQRGSSQHHAQFACLVSRAGEQWQDTFYLLNQQEIKNSLALQVA